MMLGDLIATARECKGWSQRDLERASGVSNPLISQIETGKIRDPGFSTVVRLVDALGLTLDRAAKAERAKMEVLRQSRERGTARKTQTANLSDPTRTY